MNAARDSGGGSGGSRNAQVLHELIETHGETFAEEAGITLKDRPARGAGR